MSSQTFYTPAEIAERLKIKKNTVYELIKRGELSSSKIGKQIRISSADLAGYLNHTNQENSEPESSPLKKDYLTHNNGLVISSQDPAVDMLCSMIEAHPQGLPVLRSNLNPYNSMYALYFGKVHAAFCNLWNPVTHEYSRSVIDHLIPGMSVGTIHLARFTLGLAVLQDNPKEIKDLHDLGQPDIQIVNREKGALTRILLDEFITTGEISPAGISGYKKELLSDQSVAAAIAAGTADVGITTAYAAHLYPRVAFIPLQEASIDLVYLSEYEHNPGIKILIEIARSEEYRAYLAQLFGYHLGK